MTGSAQDLDLAFERLHQIDPATLPADSRSAYLSNLGGVLGYRYRLNGRRADLDASIDHLRNAVRFAGDGLFPAGHRSNLATALVLRFRLFGSPEDIDEAIATLRRAIAIVPPRHVARAGMLAELGGALTYRFQRLGQSSDLDAGVDALHESVANTPAEHSHRAAWLSNLGATLMQRFLIECRPEDLAAASRYATEAVAITTVDDPGRARFLAHLSRVQQAQAGETGRRDLADEAVETARAATDPLPSDPTLAVMRLRALGDALALRHELTDDPTDRAEAATANWRAARVDGAPYLHRATCARAAADLFGPHDWPAAASCLAEAVQLVAGLAGRRLARSGREHFLAQFTGVATDAAAPAVQVGDPRRGLALLEQGRAVMLAQTLETRQDLTALRAVRPELADRLAQLGPLLDHDDASGVWV